MCESSEKRSLQRLFIVGLTAWQLCAEVFVAARNVPCFWASAKELELVTSIHNTNTLDNIASLSLIHVT